LVTYSESWYLSSSFAFELSLFDGDVSVIAVGGPPHGISDDIQDKDEDVEFGGDSFLVSSLMMDSEVLLI
jgi:hypothetical protein